MDTNKMLEALDNYYENTHPDVIKEHFAKMFTGEVVPSGWISIEEHLPMVDVEDFISKGYSEFKVKYANGKTGKGYVTDHNTWYYYSKEQGITHWFNEKYYDR